MSIFKKSKNKIEKVIYTLEQQKIIDHINQLSHRHMCLIWRYAHAGHKYFNMRYPYYNIFEHRLFKVFDGFTPEISKSIDKSKLGLNHYEE